MIEPGLPPDWDPAITLHPLRIWIHGQPQDGWLDVTARCSTPHAVSIVRGSLIHLDELREWHSQLVKVRESMSGTALLNTDEGLILARITLHDRRGELEIRLTADPFTEQHVYTDGIDQSYLPALINDIARALRDLSTA